MSALKIMDPLEKNSDGELLVHEDHVHTMKTLLVEILPLAVPGLAQKRKKNPNSTHMELLSGPNSGQHKLEWVNEMATTIHLLHNFCDNIFKDPDSDKENQASIGNQTGNGKKPSRLLQTKEAKKNNRGHCHKTAHTLTSLVKEEGFENRMAAWDLICCGIRPPEKTVQESQPTTETMEDYFEIFAQNRPALKCLKASSGARQPSM